MSRNLLIYLVGTLIIAVVVGVGVQGPEGWTWGLIAWGVSAMLAFLLYGEQRGHPAVLLVPFLGLLSMFYLKVLSTG